MSRLSDSLLRLPSSLALLAAASACASALAAPVKIAGAELDLPAACKPVEGAAVCSVDGQQLEVWVSHTPLGAGIQLTDSFMRRLGRFTEIHNAAIASITRSTGNDSVERFDSYGSYSALGSVLRNKAPGKPVVRFASIMIGGEVWQVLEAVAERTPAVEAVSAQLQASLKLPTPALAPPAATPDGPVKSGETAVATPAPDAPASPPVLPPGPPNSQPFIGTLFALYFPAYLQPDAVENAVDAVVLNLRRRSHGGGPNVSITLRNIRDSSTLATLVAAQKAASTASMAGATAAVDNNRFGALEGAGYALIGTPDTKKGLSGVESLDSYFVAEINGRRLEVRMTAERAYAADAQATWAMLGNTFKLIN